MPAAAVIPAPRVYIRVAAVKKLVVGMCGGLAVWVGAGSNLSSPSRSLCERWGRGGVFLLSPKNTLNKLDCSRKGFCPEYLSME